MQAIQINLDDELVNALKDNSEAQELGEVEFVRHALRFYLRVKEEAEIRRQYQSGYGNADLSELALEMKDWENEQAWPKQ